MKGMNCVRERERENPALEFYGHKTGRVNLKVEADLEFW